MDLQERGGWPEMTAAPAVAAAPAMAKTRNLELREILVKMEEKEGRSKGFKGAACSSTMVI